jgi:hypothetical protein
MMLFGTGLGGCFGIWLGMVGWVGLGSEILGVLMLLLSWKRDRARSMSMAVCGVMVGGMFLTGCAVLGRSCPGAALLFDKRESAKLGSIVAVRSNLGFALDARVYGSNDVAVLLEDASFVVNQ